MAPVREAVCRLHHLRQRRIEVSMEDPLKIRQFIGCPDRIMRHVFSVKINLSMRQVLTNAFPRWPREVARGALGWSTARGSAIRGCDQPFGTRDMTKSCG